MRLGIVVSLLLLGAACSGADDAPVAEGATTSEPVLEATEPTKAPAAAEDADGTFTIVSGAAAEEGDTDVNAFDFHPSEVQARPGDTLRFETHVVSFGDDVGPHDPENFAPPTIPPGDDYTGGAAISGVFGGPPFPSTTYALTFPDPGRYAYLCPIHPGMAGVVEVE